MQGPLPFIPSEAQTGCELAIPLVKGMYGCNLLARFDQKQVLHQIVVSSIQHAYALSTKQCQRTIFSISRWSKSILPMQSTRVPPYPPPNVKKEHITHPRSVSFSEHSLPRHTIAEIDSFMCLDLWHRIVYGGSFNASIGLASVCICL